MATSKIEVIVASSVDSDVLSSEMWLDDELIGEIVPVDQELHIILCPPSGRQFHRMKLTEFEQLFHRAKKEAEINLQADLFNSQQVWPCLVRRYRT